MTLLEAASIACSSERLLAVMSIQDVRKMHAFLNAILSDVICKQVLPNVVKPFHDAFGLDFSF